MKTRRRDLIFKIPTCMRKDSFEICRPSGHVPSKRFVSPALGPRVAHVNKPKVPVISKIIQSYVCVSRVPTLDMSTLKYAGGNVVRGGADKSLARPTSRCRRKVGSVYVPNCKSSLVTESESDRESCEWDQHVGQTIASITFVMAHQFLVGKVLLIIKAS
jgi:hypothetical protein